MTSLKKISIILSVIFLANMLSGCATSSSTSGRIAFYSTQASNNLGKSGIYVINADGSGLRYLTKGAGAPVWSPDGQQIAFRGTGIDLLDMNDSQQIVLISSFEGGYSDPTWSPDGKRLAFAIGENTNSEINIITAVGTDLKRLQLSNYERTPAWSPNGKWIAYISVKDESDYSVIKVGIADVETDNHLQHILTNDYPNGKPNKDTNPAWSPDGQTLAFFSGLDGQIHIADIEDAFIKHKIDNTKPLTSVGSTSLSGSSPAWSPDGKQIAFISKQNGNAEIYVINIDGSKEIRLTNNSVDDLSPAWSPDGKQIAFVSNRDGNQEIYVMDADGSHLLRLTNNDVDDYDPVWQPQPQP